MKELLQNNIIPLMPIIILSLISVSLIIHKLVYFFSIRIRNQFRINNALTELLNGNYNKSLEFIKKDKSPTADIIRYEGKLLGEGDRHVFTFKIEALAQRKIFEMEKYVTYLSTIANVATLLGLLGTVIGMIITFYDMMISKSSDPYTLAGGISQALITTAAGLIVAVPAILFYSIYISIIKRHISSMESATSEILASKES